MTMDKHFEIRCNKAVIEDIVQFHELVARHYGLNDAFAARASATLTANLDNFDTAKVRKSRKADYFGGVKRLQMNVMNSSYPKTCRKLS
jgi:hypothetical protein